MSLIKRITILAALAAMTASMSGCLPAGLFYELYGCAYRDDNCTPAEGEPTSEVDPTPPVVELSVAATGPRGNPFRARLTTRSGTRPVVFKRPGGAGAANVVTRGRFSGSFAGDSRTGRRFSSGRWISRGDLNYRIRSRKLTGDAYMLLRFKRRDAGSLCLSVRIRAAATKRGKIQTRGSFVALGGTGEGAKVVGSGSFSQLSGRSSGRLRGRGRLQIATKRPLPPLCAALAQMR